MRLIKRELAKKLGVSERALTTWQNEGMPVLEHGRRGQPSYYDLARVIAWIRQTGRGLNMRAGAGPIDLEAIERELEPLPSTLSTEVLVRAVALARVDFLETARACLVDGPRKDDATHHLYLSEAFVSELQTRLRQLGGAAAEPIAEALDGLMRDGPRERPRTLSAAITEAREMVPRGWLPSPYPFDE